MFSCAVQDDSDLISRYVDSICAEIDTYGLHLRNSKLVSIYFGGGTPSILTIDQLDKILKCIKLNFPNISNEIEPCLECSPDNLTTEYIHSLYEIGFRRVSVGVQSFNQNILNNVNRQYDSSIYSISAEFHNIGLNFNLDLIYGLPNQTASDAISDLEKAIKLSPQTITIYPLAIRKLTGLESVNPKIVMSMEEKYKLFSELRGILEANNYECQTAVRFVRSKNSTYQQQRLEYLGIPTVGVGAGARSYAPKVHYCLPYRINQNTVRQIINKYVSTPLNELAFDGFRFNTDELKRKFITLSLLDPGVDMNTYQDTFSCSILDDFRDEFDALFEIGLVECKDNLLILTRRGRQYCDIVVEIFQSEQVLELYSSYIPE